MRDSSDATSLIWMPVDKLLPSEDNNGDTEMVATIDSLLS